MTAKMKRAGCIWFSVIGVLFFFFSFACRELEQTGNIAWNAKWTLGLLIKSIVLGIVLGCALGRGLIALEEWCGKQQERKQAQGTCCHPKKTFFLVLGALFVCWLPTWLAYFPGICAYDTTIQMGQIADGTYNTHHPLAHTLLLGGFWNLGRSLGNANIGIGLYTLLQMLVLAAAFAAVSALLARRGIKRPIIIGLTIVTALFPVNWYMSVTTTKDILFTVFVLLGFFLFLEILWQENGASYGWHIGYVAVTIGMILFRNNGMYALLVVWVFLILAVFWTRKKGQKQYKGLLAGTTIALVAGCLLMAMLAKVTDAQEGDKREMLSMPIQQLARSMIYHGGVGLVPEDDATLAEEDKALIRELFWNVGYEGYRADISDPVKKMTNTAVVRYQPVRFAKTYLKLLLQYPGDYINATLGTNAGFLNPDDKTHATINKNGRDVGLGYIQTRWVDAELNPKGIYKDSKWAWLRNVLETFADENMYLKIPILRYLVAPGLYLWCYMLLAAWLLIHKRYGELLPFTFVLGYYLTLFLGPTVQLRYLYPLMVVLPYLLIYLKPFAKGEKNIL